MAGSSTIEIERKFLVASDAWSANAVGLPIRQGYLARASHCVVRVRTYGERAFVTIKSDRSGLTRSEYEYEIPFDHAVEMLALCEGAVIEKVRHRIEHADHTWEVDVFSGPNAGLVVAEIELGAEDEPFERPAWLGEEVSGDPRYANAYLSLHPYSESRDEP